MARIYPSRPHLDRVYGDGEFHAPIAVQCRAGWSLVLLLLSLRAAATAWHLGVNRKALTLAVDDGMEYIRCLAKQYQSAKRLAREA